MTARRILIVVVTILAVEVAVFQFVYRDVLWFNQPVATLQAAPADVAADTAREALSRRHLSRRHLEAIASATNTPALLEEHVDALERLHQLTPDDAHVTVRLADAYRRAGRFDDARRLFTTALEAPLP